MKVGCLWSMTSEVSAEDPCPQLPASFVDPGRMQRMVREIQGFSGHDASAKDEAEEPRVDERSGRPRPLARSVIAALEIRQQALGEPPDETSKTALSAIVAVSLGYLRNQQSRMDYSTYRKQGLPMTSTYVESTVKQINRRMKGTEKFWSQGVEPMLTLVADHLSDTPTLARFWRNRPQRLTGSRRYQSTAA